MVLSISSRKKDLARFDMISTLGDEAPALSTKEMCATRFARGKGILETDQKFCRLAAAIADQIFDGIYHMVMYES